MSDSTEKTASPTPPRTRGALNTPPPARAPKSALQRLREVEDDVRALRSDVRGIAERMDDRFDTHEARTSATMSDFRADLAATRASMEHLRTDLLHELRAPRQARERCWGALAKAAETIANKVDGRIVTAGAVLALLAVVAGLANIAITTEWGTIGAAVQDTMSPGGGD